MSLLTAVLPLDMHQAIFNYLSRRDLETASRVCRGWRQWIHSESFAQHHAACRGMNYLMSRIEDVWREYLQIDLPFYERWIQSKPTVERRSLSCFTSQRLQIVKEKALLISHLGEVVQLDAKREGSNRIKKLFPSQGANNYAFDWLC